MTMIPMIQGTSKYNHTRSVIFIALFRVSKVENLTVTLQLPYLFFLIRYIKYKVGWERLCFVCKRRRVRHSRSAFSFVEIFLPLLSLLPFQDKLSVTCEILSTTYWYAVLVRLVQEQRSLYNDRLYMTS